MSETACSEKTHLLVEYQKATEIYAQAVAELSRQIGIVPKDEYRRLSWFAEQKRHDSVDARDRLERHVAQHGC